MLGISQYINEALLCTETSLHKILHINGKLEMSLVRYCYQISFIYDVLPIILHLLHHLERYFLKYFIIKLILSNTLKYEPWRSPNKNEKTYDRNLSFISNIFTHAHNSKP